MVFKADFAKAYDSIRWDYLDDVLDGFGFESKWRSWIKGSISSGMASILVNGSPTSEFQFHCGLKQGDPLAPYLFILVIESLHPSFMRATDEGFFKGIKVGSSLNLSHLFYADDAIFVGEWSDDNLRSIMYMLNCFSMASGLGINLKKSHLLGVSVSDDLISHVAGLLGCRVLKPPFKYLGIIVGGSMSKVNAWDDSIDKIKARLSKWKLSTLSIGGRLTLLKSVLGSTPIYSMSMYKVLKLVLNSMESLRRNFFNGVQGEDRKIAWIKWSKVLASKKYGGLGVNSFYALNRALLFKWVWRFISNDGSLWFHLINAMHGNSLQVSSSCYYSPWKVILKETVKECMVADKLPGSLSLSFRRAVRGGAETQQFEQLQLLVDTVILLNVYDRWFWDLNGEGVFCVKDARNLIDETFPPKEPIATRWLKIVPIKVNIIAWKLHHDRLLIRANLVRRGVHVYGLFCPVCETEIEEASHLFFCYGISRDVTHLICQWWNISWMQVGTYEE
uniref:RNA-directed DNA polymerase, eukaryota, reverse transcriptase zinc-binding domain protein n=1 Tax=Tanacetum cinerariifolium TaxID=118510 RepID=A0A6L2MM85_TANCI|nr:RNA-directed DNA polymerase, eukaryota, reverse transcriptase zinc-binding domain protein [Tanacetum cinerariifolium]